MLITGCDTGIGQHISTDIIIVYCKSLCLGHEVARHLDSLGCLVFAGCQVSDNDHDLDNHNDNDPDDDNDNDNDHDPDDDPDNDNDLDPDDDNVNVRTRPRRAPRGCGWRPAPGCSWSTWT